MGTQLGFPSAFCRSLAEEWVDCSMFRCTEMVPWISPQPLAAMNWRRLCSKQQGHASASSSRDRWKPSQFVAPWRWPIEQLGDRRARTAGVGLAFMVRVVARNVPRRPHCCGLR